MSSLGARLKSFAKGLTSSKKTYGIVLKTDKAQMVLEQPRNAGFKNLPGGVYFCIDHKGGKYMVEASMLAEYSEMTPDPLAGGGKIVARKGSY